MSLPTYRIMMVSCLALLVAGVVSAFTYDDDQLTVDQADETATTETTASPAGGDGRDERVEGDDGDPATTTGDDTSTTTAPDGASTTTSPNTASASDPTNSDGPVPGTTPTEAGTYHYDIAGTVTAPNPNNPLAGTTEQDVSGTSTLRVPEAGPDGRQAQVEEEPDGTSTTTYRFTPEGTYLEQLRVQVGSESITLDATEPFLLVPAGVSPGTVTRGTLRGDGLTAEVTFDMIEFGPEESTAQLQVDMSGSVDFSGIDADVDGSMRNTIVARSRDQLPLEMESTTDITVSTGLGEVATSSDVRSVLQR